MAGSVEIVRAAATPSERQGLRHRLLRTLVALCVALPAGLLASVATGGAWSATALADEPLVNGGGSSYASVALNDWAAQVKVRYGMNINYNVSSSVQGMNEFSLNQLNVGASEIGYSTKQADQQPSGNYQYLPDVAGATCLDYHLTAVNGQPIHTLLLNSAVMTKIFTAQIKSWDDPAIKALNPHVLLPHQPIIVVWREDPSGDNYLFSQYLNWAAPSVWQPFDKALGYYKFGNYATAVWPAPNGQQTPPQYNFSGWVGQQGSDNASYYVASTPGAITYVETAYALQHGDPCAYLQNASGSYVEPSEYNDAVALTKAQLLPDLEQLLNGVYANRDAAAYPISAYSYLITHESGYPGSMAAELGKFVEFLACYGQQAAGALGYSPLPPVLVARDFQAVDRIIGAAKLPSEPSASNCQNPYVDGQIPLPGPQPVIQGGSPTPGSSTGPTSNSGPTSTTLASSGGPTTTVLGGGASGSNGTSGRPGSNAKKGSQGSQGTLSNGPGVISSPQQAQPGGPTTNNGFALLSAATGLQRQANPDALRTLWILLSAMAVLGLPPAVLARRQRRRHGAGL